MSRELSPEAQCLLLAIYILADGERGVRVDPELARHLVNSHTYDQLRAKADAIIQRKRAVN